MSNSRYEFILFDAYHFNINPMHCSEQYTHHLVNERYLIEGSYELCAYLSSRGYRIAVLTNGINEVQLKRVFQSEISHLVEEVITSEEAGNQKPHPGIFDYTFRKLDGWIRDRTLIVGDSITSDIQGGMNYGIDTCWFNPFHKKNDHGITPTYEIRGLREVREITL